MGLIKHGIIHTHTGNSVKDSVLSPTDLVKRAAELGAPAVVLSDHGVLTGVFEFMRAAKENGIKGIPGVEAYVQEDDTTGFKRSHFMLIPMDYIGYKAISKATTRSYSRLIDGMPCMNMAILQECFGVGTEGHGHVISTSACMGGILSRILLSDIDLEKDLRTYREKLNKYNNPKDPAYLQLKRSLTNSKRLIDDLCKERDSLTKLASRKFSIKERALDKLSGAELAAAQNELDAEKKQTEDAKRTLALAKGSIVSKRKEETAIRQQCAAHAKTHQQWYDTQDMIARIETTMKGDAELYNEMKRKAKQLSGIFGYGNFYVELQNHRIPEESFVMPLLARAAEELNLPTVACNDVHYADNTPECVRARQIMQSLRFNSWNHLRPGDTEYYIKDDKELTAILSEILPANQVERAMEGIGKIIERCNVQFPTGMHLPKFKGGLPGESAVERLTRLAKEGIAWRYPNSDDFTQAHAERMEYELKVIKQLGYCDYLCIVQDFLDYGRRLGTDNREGVGLGVGPGRGSAVGSLVCYLAGITSTDPLKYGLLFERFLNVDRISMPDIDSDFGMEIRGEVINYVKEKYGEKAICCIVTKGTLAAKAAVRNVARVLGDEMYNDTQSLYQKGDAIAKAIPKTPGIQLEEVLPQLKQKFADDEISLKIIEDARIVEGANYNHGMHAAGVIISDNEDISGYIPLMYNSDQGQWMSQCDMVEAEKDAGLMKMDFLGLRTLNIITDTLRAVYRNKGIKIDIETVPFEAEVFENIFSSGRTNGIFQFESPGMKTMLKQFRPGSIEDVILLVAAYRPGPMQYLDEIITAKHGKSKPVYIVPEMENIMAETYGRPVYQEQIMMVANRIAGFTLGESDVIRAAISKKKMKELLKYKDKFIAGLVAAGATERSAEAFWAEMLDFGRYAFNKSHACAYAHLAYYTAWLKHYHPTEFLVATLNYTDTKKLPMMLKDCREFNQTVLPPDINTSDFGFNGKDGVIRFGLSNIKSVKEVGHSIISERTKAGFSTFPELLSRLSMQKNETEALIDSGAMDTFGYSRNALGYILPLYMDDLKVIGQKSKIVADLGESDTALMSEKELKSWNTKFANATKKLEEYQYRYEQTVIPTDMPDERLGKLSREHALLGMYISGDPLQSYPSAKTERTNTVSNVSDGERVTLCGMVGNAEIRNRRSDGAPMCFFTLSDESGDISVSCFTEAYSAYGEMLSDGTVIAVTGKCYADTGMDDEDPEIKLNVRMVKALESDKPALNIAVDNVDDWQENVYPAMRLYIASDGHPVRIFSRENERFYETDIRLMENVLSMGHFNIESWFDTN